MFTKSKDSFKNIIYLAIAFLILGIYSILIIIPNYYKLNDFDVQINKIKEQIEEQKLLIPVYIDLKKRIEKYSLPNNLPAPKDGVLSKEEIGQIASMFEEICIKTNLKLENIKSDVSKEGTKSFLSVNTIIKGGLFDLRNFFMALSDQPFNKYIEQIQIKAIPGNKEIKLKIWIAQA